jgi:hypothetical protein
MHHMTSTVPGLTGPEAVPASALAQSALQLTRAAIARWSGNARPACAPARDLARVSPQARWLADTRYGLDEWIARGGFAQSDEATLTAPTIHHSVDACID